ncbi:unnamed protein product [Penicillium salamii]|nr:unnamed protein product [Penicillium salamii]
MLAPDHSVSSQQMSKRRLACERCRNQKLKCIRTDENDCESCSRCQQAEAQCIISLRKTPGRPAGGGNPSGQQKSNRERRETQDRRLDSTMRFDSGFVPGDGSIISDDLFALPSDFSLDDCGSDPAGVFSSASSIYSQDFMDSLFKDPSPVTDFPISWNASRNSSVTGSHQSFHLLDQKSDPGLQLSHLQQKLSKQLILLRSLSWDVTTVLKLDSGLCSCQRQSCEREDFNPLTSTFEVISEFEHLLNNIKGMINRRELQGLPGFRQEMNVSYAFTAMSCYLQLVCIYDCIFSYVLDQASNNPVVRDFILHATPNISLGGFIIPSPKNVCGRSFVELMQFKMRPIESALGLPDDCCLSKEPCRENSPARAGLLSGKQGESLLVALKESGVEETNGTKALGGLGSLKDKIMRIESIE